MIIKGQNMHMPRGDSEAFVLRMKSKTTGFPYKLEAGDVVRFTVKKDTRTKIITLQKVITEFTEEGWAHVNILPNDTKDLSYGTYRYDVEITFKDGTVKTTIKQPAFFVLEEEVTH